MPRFTRLARFASITLAGVVLFAAGCGDDDDDMRDFTLRFAAVDGAVEVGCGDVLTGFGTGGLSKVEISDLRFYVSNLKFYNEDGEELDITLDTNEFQYTSADGSVALIDLTGTDIGACSGAGVTFAEGTARTNSVVTGMVGGGEVSRVSFDVGIPQAMMKTVIANNTAEDAPSPLAEMHWSWAFAYRHLVMNYTIENGAGVDGEGYLHVGSNDCGGDGTKALTDRESCGRVNAPAVSLNGFDLDDDVVAINVRELLEGIDMTEMIDETPVPGSSCHSSTSQPDCAGIFANLGITQATGVSSTISNEVFEIK